MLPVLRYASMRAVRRRSLFVVTHRSLCCTVLGWAPPAGNDDDDFMGSVKTATNILIWLYIKEAEGNRMRDNRRPASMPRVCFVFQQQASDGWQ